MYNYACYHVRKRKAGLNRTDNTEKNMRQFIVKYWGLKWERRMRS